MKRQIQKISQLKDYYVNSSKNYYELKEVYKKCISWIQSNTIDGKGIKVHNDINLPYPEVSGYYIPSLLNFGYNHLATQYADWLVTIQDTDGAWRDVDGKCKYVFDTGMILKGLLSLVDEHPEYKDSIIRGCDYLCSTQNGEGELIQSDTSSWNLGSIRKEIHLYCLSAMIEAGEKFGVQKYIDSARRALEYYLTIKDLTKFNCLSHFHAYILEALVDLGESSVARVGMRAISRKQRSSGFIPSYRHQLFATCSTALFQYSVIWYKLGDIYKADKSFGLGCKIQNESGGWYGSYGFRANYAKMSEISWANKYFLDALHNKISATFDSQYQNWQKYFDKKDPRYVATKKTIENIKCKNLLDVGCGCGAYLRNIKEDFHDIDLFGVDISPRLISRCPAFVTAEIGTFYKIPYKSESFDLVLCHESLEHAIDLNNAIREMSRVVKKGGFVYLIDKDVSKLARTKLEQWESWLDYQKCKKAFAECSIVLRSNDTIDFYLPSEKRSDVFFGLLFQKK